MKTEGAALFGDASGDAPTETRGQSPLRHPDHHRTRYPALARTEISRHDARQSELAIINEARGDPAAFAPLYERYVDLVYAFCLRRLRDPDRAADATSITFSQAIAAIPRFKPVAGSSGSTFRSWLLTIARNAVIDDTRRQRPHATLDDDVVRNRIRDTAPSPEDHAVAASERERIEAALDQLPERQRQIVELRLFGLKGAEIAAVLGMSESAVKTAHFRAYARLRTLLETNDSDQHKGSSS